MQPDLVTRRCAPSAIFRVRCTCGGGITTADGFHSRELFDEGGETWLRFTGVRCDGCGQSVTLEGGPVLHGVAFLPLGTPGWYRVGNGTGRRVGAAWVGGMSRKPVAAWEVRTDLSRGVHVVCNDGTAWFYDYDDMDGWAQVTPPVPGTKADKDPRPMTDRIDDWAARELEGMAKPPTVPPGYVSTDPFPPA